MICDESLWDFLRVLENWQNRILTTSSRRQTPIISVIIVSFLWTPHHKLHRYTNCTCTVLNFSLIHKYRYPIFTIYQKTCLCESKTISYVIFNRVIVTMLQWLSLFSTKCLVVYTEEVTSGGASTLCCVHINTPEHAKYTCMFIYLYLTYIKYPNS